jgi:hypothetical protein
MTTKSDIYLRFKEFNSSNEQQSMLSEIAKIRGYTDNRRFNLALAVQMNKSSAAQNLLGDTILYPLCFSSRDGHSLIHGKIFIPGFAPDGSLITYICYDWAGQQEAKLTNTSVPSYYCPASGLFSNRGSYMYAPIDCWDNIISSRSIYVTDGVWDCVTLNMLDVPALAILSSEISTGVARILNVFKHVHLVMDNDSAGGRLYKQMINIFSSVSRVVVPVTIAKDIDEYAAKVGGPALLRQLKCGCDTYLKGD